MDIRILKQLNELRRARRAAVLVTQVSDGSARLISDHDSLDGDPLREEIARAFRTGQSKSITTEAGEVFLTAEIPAPRIVAIGAVHISQALVPLAKLSGFDITIIDPRTAFATPERFPDVTLLADWPETVLPDLNIDPYTALAALTHDPKIDDFALVHALQRGCFYVGALGSRKTHAKRAERLKQSGIDETSFATIKAPIGLDIGASSPAEIAVAVMAEIIAAFRKRDIGATS